MFSATASRLIQPPRTAGKLIAAASTMLQALVGRSLAGALTLLSSMIR